MQPKKYILAKAKEEGKTNLGPSNRRYFFRNTIPAVQRFKPPTPKSNSKGPNRQTILFNDARLPRGRDGRSSGNRRRKASNYDFSGSSGDEDRNFEAAHKRSVMRARKEFMPLNMTSEEMEETARARGRHGTSALADIEPMECDKEVGFTDIGGLDRTIDTLKEMVIFPLLYPEFYDHFKVKSARGILLHGPPGTGKTLVARALANECTKVGCQKVAFFMRKGSDCLSKWVGESERQLRLLFDQAYLLRPSVIFFDEVRGVSGKPHSSYIGRGCKGVFGTIKALYVGKNMLCPSWCNLARMFGAIVCHRLQRDMGTLNHTYGRLLDQ
ncbi:hypothetical protein SARC_04488 [Sphaeroforma arctica JP610]|uniref:AAA+ ATPase domain-containing protein n=1 Tax=Sphaeroforma arctica JP610 TaxID=667725 RepID=A0A0L0G334_9EUKA|nr:hypothetical protein SARC_04488 [Sphaeroforma arctica JP610]KNC83251.1 hypothetical protein SARC_04488 [Sphaeroforma arctica JP610]|eukprot:XP_014157153.1 hypothetical protein SARC_04488 [Sphaeroforma arctica JP610]